MGYTPFYEVSKNCDAYELIETIPGPESVLIPTVSLNDFLKEADWIQEQLDITFMYFMNDKNELEVTPCLWMNEKQENKELSYSIIMKWYGNRFDTVKYDFNGNLVKRSKDGADGENGTYATDGKNGIDGKNGEDGTN